MMEKKMIIKWAAFICAILLITMFSLFHTYEPTANVQRQGTSIVDLSGHPIQNYPDDMTVEIIPEMGEAQG